MCRDGDLYQAAGGMRELTAPSGSSRQKQRVYTRPSGCGEISMRLLLCISSACRRVLGASGRHCRERGSVTGGCRGESREPQPCLSTQCDLGEGCILHRALCWPGGQASSDVPGLEESCPVSPATMSRM